MPIGTIPRVAYFAQTGAVITSSVGAYTLPISSANIEETRPIEAITSFGQFISLNTAQTNLTTCKCSFKTYLGSGEAGSAINGLTAASLNDIVNNTQSGTLMQIAVGPDGFTMSGILSSLSIDISMGGFGMADMSFAGVGKPILNPPVLTSTPISTGAWTLAPVTTISVAAGANATGPLSGVYANSLKFSYDLPTDVLSALGDNPNAYQGNMTSTIATKAPYKSTITVEGHGVDPTIQDSSIANFAYSIGNIGITLPHAKVNSRSFSNAAGQVSASFTYTCEDTSVVFSNVTLQSFADNNAVQPTPPSWGA